MMILENTIMTMVYAFQQLRSRRKGGGGGPGGANANTPASGVGGADKENVDFRSRRRPNAGDSCSSGSSGGNGSVNRRHDRNHQRLGGDKVRESQSADLASISSTSGAANLAICDMMTQADFDRLLEQPIGMDSREWMASHMLALFHHVNALYGTICEYCTKEFCPVISGPGNVQFFWVDDKNKKIKYPAPQYIDCVMSFAERTVRSEDVFPTKFGHEFPPNFEITLRKLCRLLYHVLAHLHIAHWEQLESLGVRSQAIAVHRHFSAFTRQFNMLELKDSVGLHDLMESLDRLSINAKRSVLEPEAIDVCTEAHQPQETSA